MDLFDFGYSEKLKEDRPLRRIKVLSLFSGIGAFEKALKNIGIDFDLVNYCDIDPYASKAYSAIHGVSEDLNLWDVIKVDTSILPKDLDLITYGFPCVDISIAGKMKGFYNEDGSHTRSGLFFEALRIINDTQPRIAIAENVRNLISAGFSDSYHTVLESLDEAGYNSHVQILNAKDFGIPQNRERVFIVSIRKDIDEGFQFPEPIPLRKSLRDVLEPEVDDKYYLSEKMVKFISTTGTKNFHLSSEIDLDVARPLTSSMACMHRGGQDNYVSTDFIRDGKKTDLYEVVERIMANER